MLTSPIPVFTMADLAVHDAPIWVFTMDRLRTQGASRRVRAAGRVVRGYRLGIGGPPTRFSVSRSLLKPGVSTKPLNAVAICGRDIRSTPAHTNQALAISQREPRSEAPPPIDQVIPVPLVFANR